MKIQTEQILSKEEFKRLLKEYFEMIANKEMVKNLKEDFENTLGLGYSGINYTLKDLYTFYTDEEVFNAEFVNMDTWSINLNMMDALGFLKKEIHYELFNFCGCGYPDAMDKLIQTFLNIIGNEDYDIIIGKYKETFDIDVYNLKSGDDAPYPNMYPDLFFFALYQLDALGLTEHGGNIFGAWLSDKGALCKDILNVCDEFDEAMEEYNKESGD